MMVSGIGFVALLTAAVAERFIRDERESDISIERHLMSVTEELRQIRRLATAATEHPPSTGNVTAQTRGVVESII